MDQIVVIEDDSSILENILEILTLEGFQAHGAADGESGIKLVQQQLPDLVLCDIMMPKLTGYEVLTRIRGDSALRGIPFIFLTALANRSAMRQGMVMGADDYLTKPFTPVELLEAVHTRITMHRNTKDKHQKDLEQLRNNIIYALPHEMRTPLMGLMGGVDLIMMDPYAIERDDLARVAELMMTSALRLHNVIENYLLYAQLDLLPYDQSRLESLRSESLELPAGIIKESATQVAHEQERTVDLQVEATDDEIKISAENLAKIIKELVSNALKFSRTGQPVKVQTQANGTYYRITITDEGRGMSPAEIKQVGAYNQFGRMLNEQQGLGLGLIIAKRLAEIHGGDLTIESTPSLPVGTVVNVSLPLA